MRYTNYIYRDATIDSLPCLLAGEFRTAQKGDAYLSSDGDVLIASTDHPRIMRRYICIRFRHALRIPLVNRYLVWGRP